MARIAGIELPNKRMEVALTYVYGIGRSMAKKILNQTHIDNNKKAGNLTDEEISLINKELTDNDYIFEGDLRNRYINSIKRLIQINCYRGQRHQRKLPVRGQRTRSNGKTRKGRGKTIANKKVASKG